jgi:beta-glucosidase
MTLRAFLAALLAACGGGAATPDAGPPDAALPAAVGNFPAGFLWGTAIAPYQVEGGLHATDWYQFETACANCSKQHADDGPDFWNHYAEDFDNAATLHNNAIRLGIEWARIFPTADSFPDKPDAAAVGRYHQILTAARARGLVVMVTLHHFSTPIWLADLTHPERPFAWESDALPEQFATWAGFCAREFGADVDWWQTINEPFGYLAAGWLGGVFPPGKLLDSVDTRAVTRNMIRGHALAYDAIHKADVVSAAGDGVAARVSFASHNRVFLPRNPASPDDVRAADLTRLINNRMFIDAEVYGNVDANYDGDYDDPGDSKDDPSLKGRLDWIGLNYYGVSVVSYASQDLFPFIGASLQNDLDRFGVKAPISDFGASIYPEGFQVVLDELAPYHLPILVTENGIADADDNQRPRFLVDHLYALARAIQGGADVRGYFHWSLIDNFEWAAGFCPHFGLFHVDRTDPARPRRAGAAVAVYRRIIDANTVPPALFAEFPGYPPADTFCDRTGY